MKKISQNLILKCVFTLVLACGIFGAGWFCRQFCSVQKIAVIDLQQVLAQSQKLMRIQQDYNTKFAEISKWLDDAEKDIGTEKIKAKRDKMLKQYKDLALEKQNLIKEDYNKQLQSFQLEVADVLRNLAQKMGYDVVLEQKSVIIGGQNISNDAIKALNQQQ